MRSFYSLLTQDKTCIIFTNNLNTLKISKQIIVFKDNQMVENGSHAELSSNINGYYSSIVYLN
jgi:ABC-type multidrug transport system fused ATPase/permease subunit